MNEFIEKLKALKKQTENELMTFKLETVQGFFEMEDNNKWLKYNAITQKEVERANSFEQHLHSILGKLYVPDYQSQNV